MEYVLQTQNLTKVYRGCTALRDLTMKVPKGAIYGLVGRNGAGKTTLIRVVCGLQEPTDGRYTLYGAPNGGEGIYKMRRRMGAVVETPSIYLDLSAAENIRQQYRVLGVPSDEGIGDLLSLVGLENTGRKTAQHFSLGMRQRLGIAVALAGEPDLLVLDEPTNGLDPQGIIEIRELILKLSRERGITVLISSHILDELARLATHYGFIDDGRMVSELSAEELEQKLRKCMRVTVSDTQGLALALESLGAEYRIVSDSEADIYTPVPVTKLTQALSAAGCDLISLRERDETLESFYMNLLGGERDA